MAEPGACNIGNLRFHVLHIGQLVAHVTHQQLASAGQPDAVRQSLENRNAKFGLHRQYSAVERC